MAILTDGPLIEPLDKWSSAYIEALEAAHRQQLVTEAAVLVVAGMVLTLAIWRGPRLWRRIRRGMAGPVRMPDPVD